MMGKNVDCSYQCGQNQQAFQQHGKQMSAQGDHQGVFHPQVGQVGAERRQLDQYCKRKASGQDTGQSHRQHVGQEVVAVVHIGQQEGHPHREDHAAQQQGLVIQAVPEEGSQQQQHKHYPRLILHTYVFYPMDF